MKSETKTVIAFTPPPLPDTADQAVKQWADSLVLEFRRVIEQVEAVLNKKQDA